MTDKAIELARELASYHHNSEECYEFGEEQLTRFYNRAQAAALLEAADYLHEQFGEDSSSNYLYSRAAELEKK